MQQRGTDNWDKPVLMDGDYVPFEIKSILKIAPHESKDGIEEIEFVLIPGDRAIAYYGTDYDERDDRGYIHYRVPAVEVEMGNPDPAFATWTCLRNIRKAKGVWIKRQGKIIDQNKELQKENSMLKLRVASLQKDYKKQMQKNNLDEEFLGKINEFIFKAVNSAMKTGGKSL